MAQATINARLNATVKERGDKVLRDNGISTTEAIRGLWSSMARTREVPSFLVRECKRDETAERRRKREGRARSRGAGNRRGDPQRRCAFRLEVSSFAVSLRGAVMKVLFDTNVWLDIILSREGFWETSLTALYDCIDEDDDLCVIATSLKDVFFLVERLKSADAAYESVERMLELARPIAVDEAVCRCALPLERPDYEDGLIAAAAEIEQIECIVTRDDGAFRDLAYAA